MTTAEKPAMTPQQAALVEPRKSAFALYKDWAVGPASLSAFCYYEFCMLAFSGLPGILGFGSRAFFYPRLFAACGKRPGIGRGVLIRNPKSIVLGKKVLVDDYAALDVRGVDASLTIGDYVSVGRFTTIAAKGGHINIANGANIGSYCRVATQSSLKIGESTLVAAYAYIGPGNHQEGDDDKPLISRDMDIKGGVTIGSKVWIGTRATIMDGVTIGDGAIVGAHSFVKDDVPAGATVVGVPARVVASAK